MAVENADAINAVFLGDTSKMQSGLARLLGLRSIFSLFGLLALALIVPACAAGDGSLTVSWTIASNSDPSLCAQYGASNVAVLVVNASGNPYSHTTPECSALSTNFQNVPVGVYNVTTQMLGDSGDPVSNSAGPIAVSVTKNNTVGQNFDFAKTAFNNYPSTGTLTVNWTIASSPAAAQCATYEALNLSIALIDSTGNPSTAVTVQCSAQTETIPNIEPGTYSVTAQMLNADGQPVSSAARATNVVISAGNTTSQTLDFPAGLFLIDASTP